AFDGGVTADFAGGVFRGVTFEIDAPPTAFPYTDVAVGDGTVQAVGADANPTTAAVSYALTDTLPDTTVMFILPNGDTATGSFTMPASQIDPTQATQQIPIGDLSVTLKGHTFTGTAFANGATANFAIGVVQ